MSNIYYSPEKFRLTIVGMVECNLAYEFDMFVVWQKRDGTLWCGTDAGCSCPSPFESHTVRELEPYTDQTLDAWRKNRSKEHRPSLAEITSLKDACFAALKEARKKIKTRR